MKKKWAILFLVVVGLWGAFMVHRHLKNQDKESQYVEETFSSMTKAAQESPKAGLTYMGMAIKRYKSEKSKYPETLDVLYPDYIKDRSFVEDVAWEYSFDQNNFRLAKTVTIEQRTYTAFVDSQLRPLDVGSERDVRTAAVGETQPASDTSTRPAARRPSPARSQAVATRAPEPPPPERTATRQELDAMKEQMLASMVEAGKQGPPPEEKEKAPPVIYTPVDDAEDVDETVAGKYLTWKNEKGVLGFGNVMYPGGEENLIYRNGKWIRVQRTEADTPLESGQADGSPAPEEGGLVGKHGKTYLAWKDKSGAIGFGNVAYPERDDNLIYHNGQWINTQKEESSTVMDRPPTSAESGTDGVAGKYGDTYLTWKDKSGVIGFGNIMYPELEEYAVYKAGQWVTAGRETPADILENPLSYADTSRDHVARKHGKEVYVWKDRSGTLGFGNMTFPEKDGISAMKSDGAWTKATETTGTGGSE